MLRILVDTSVWLDLAKDWRHQAVIETTKELFKAGEISLIVPDVVRDEFARNKERVVAESRRSLQSQFKLVREAVERFGLDDSKRDTLHALNEVDQRIAMKGEAVNDSIKWIEGLIAGGVRKSTTKAIKQRIAERAIAGLAPYHRSKNSAGDAVIIETYADLVGRDTGRDGLAFVTHNVKDFSDPVGDMRRPHPDLADLFDGDRSTYWTSFAELIKASHPGWFEEVDAELHWLEEPRKLSEILGAVRLAERQVWYNRHWNLRIAIEEGDHRLVTHKEWDAADPSQRNELTVDSVWQRALEAARKTEEELGTSNLGPWSDFEWGMLNGKLSALRWVLGEEWDFLDT